MWVVVFTTSDVAAVPFSWILRKNGKIMCFWPLNNPRSKIKENVKPPESPNEYWELHECRLLFNEATFKSYKLANQKEIDGQKHSNLESQEESDFVRVNTRKHPRTNFSCDFDDNSSENFAETPKRPKHPKQPAKTTRENPFSSESSSDDNEYVFIKNVQKDLHNFTDVPMLEREESNEASTSAGGCVVEKSLDTAESGAILEKVDEIQTNITPTTTSDNDVLETEQDVSDQTATEEDTANTILESVDELQTTIIISDDVVLATEQSAIITSDDVVLETERDESNQIATNSILLETVDLSEDVIGPILQKLSEILHNQNDLKKVLVDLTYKVMKLENQIKKFNIAPITGIVRQLGLRITDKEKFNEVQIALNDAENYEKLVHFASSLQEPSVNEFVKRFMKTVFDMEFLYINIVWRTDANKILFKGTKIACCLFDAIKIKFSVLNEKQMEDAAILATKQIKDCFRKKK